MLTVANRRPEHLPLQKGNAFFYLFTAATTLYINVFLHDGRKSQQKFSVHSVLCNTMCRLYPWGVINFLNAFPSL